MFPRPITPTRTGSRSRINIFWFRRDLRLTDNAGLFHALKSDLPVLPLFIFDTNILDKLNSKTDARVIFIHSEVEKLKCEIEKTNSSIKILNCSPLKAFQQLVNEFEINDVYTNKDYEPYGLERDSEVCQFLKNKSIGFNSFKDHVIFEENEIVKDDGKPYSIFTPFSKKWKMKFEGSGIPSFPSEKLLNGLIKTVPFSFPKLNELKFKGSRIRISPFEIDESLISNYEKFRDFPAENGTSKIGIHLRFGTVSIREIVEVARKKSEIFLNELIWREFFMQILWHFPGVVKNAFKPKYDFVNWRNNEAEFQKWCKGETGYPLVDAGMRELNTTGFMHNRVRMVTASFLVKHLLIDWRWGEAYFSEKLLDFELASNNGNWQWAAGCGCDAAPYFRVFNPETQQKKFDNQYRYIKKWIPEFGTNIYPLPIVEHKFARERVLRVYKEALE